MTELVADFKEDELLTFPVDPDYIRKLQCFQEKMQALIAQANTAVLSGEDASIVLTQIAGVNDAYVEQLTQIRNDVASIAESGLPAQASQKHKQLKTNGLVTGWAFDGEFTRNETTSHTLEPGDRAFIIATGAIVESELPETIALGQPYTVKNSLTSNSNVRVVNENFTIYDKRINYAPGDNPMLVPGEQITMIAISTTQLEVL